MENLSVRKDTQGTLQSELSGMNLVVLVLSAEGLKSCRGSHICGAVPISPTAKSFGKTRRSLFHNSQLLSISGSEAVPRELAPCTAADCCPASV